MENFIEFIDNIIEKFTKTSVDLIENEVNYKEKF